MYILNRIIGIVVCVITAYVTYNLDKKTIKKDTTTKGFMVEKLQFLDLYFTFHVFF